MVVHDASTALMILSLSGCVTVLQGSDPTLLMYMRWAREKNRRQPRQELLPSSSATRRRMVKVCRGFLKNHGKRRVELPEGVRQGKYGVLALESM